MELDFDQYKAQQFCDNPDCDAYGKGVLKFNFPFSDKSPIDVG